MSTRASCLRFAVTRAALGERVVYVCARRDSTRDAFLFAEKLAKRHFTQWVERIYCARWEQQIRFTSGGVVMFPNPQCRNYRGMSSDVLILEYGAEAAGAATSLLGGAKTVHRATDTVPETDSEAKE